MIELGVSLYASYLCSRDALGRPSAVRDDRVSCIQWVSIKDVRNCLPIFEPSCPNLLTPRTCPHL